VVLFTLRKTLPNPCFLESMNPPSLRKGKDLLTVMGLVRFDYSYANPSESMLSKKHESTFPEKKGKHTYCYRLT